MAPTDDVPSRRTRLQAANYRRRYQQLITYLLTVQSKTRNGTAEIKLHCVSNNVPPFDLPLSWHTRFDYDNFGADVTKKVGNQNVLCFPTSPNYCFCTIWGNRKPGNCVFSLKCCMLFTNNTRNTLKYNLVTAEPLFTVKTIDWMHHAGPRKGT